MNVRPLLICLIPSAFVVVLAQEKPPAAASPDNPLTANTRMMYGVISQRMLLAAAEKMPEEHYSFKPTDAVRSYGQIIGHVADLQYMHCSVVLGEKNPALKIEQTRTAKADLIAALRQAVAYCDKAYGGMTDALAVEMIGVSGREMPKLGMLTVNLTHSSLHYGNLVTYMRLKNIVPPSSEPDFMKPPKK